MSRNGGERMKKLADFLVNKRYILLTVMLVLAVVCGILAATIKTNRDMTKYCRKTQYAAGAFYCGFCFSSRMKRLYPGFAILPLKTLKLYKVSLRRFLM